MSTAGRSNGGRAVSANRSNQGNNQLGVMNREGGIIGNSQLQSNPVQAGSNRAASAGKPAEPVLDNYVLPKNKIL